MKDAAYRIRENDMGWHVYAREAGRGKDDGWYHFRGPLATESEARAVMLAHISQVAMARLKMEQYDAGATYYDDGGFPTSFAGAGAMGAVAQVSSKPIGGITCPQWPTYACQCIEGGTCGGEEEWR